MNGKLVTNGGLPVKIRVLMAAVAASATLIMPVAAQAGTSAASMAAPVSYGSHSTKTVKGKNNGFALTLPIALLAIASAVTAVVIVVDDKT